MTLTAAAPRRLIAVINVTPMIDVLLVLLITFMLIAPTLSHGLEARVPQPASESSPAQPNAIVVSVEADRSVRINSQAVTMEALPERLRPIFSTRPDGVLFLRGAASLEFQDVARVLDVARGVGIARVALVTGK
jgi:biopolymer transport protein ExbD